MKKTAVSGEPASVSGSPVLHIYTRVSTVAQQDKGTSLESQERIGRERASQLGFEVKLWNEGGKSSNHEDLSGRPVLQALLAAVQRGEVKHVFVSDHSRLSRTDAVASAVRVRFKEQAVTLHSKDGTCEYDNPLDNCMRQIVDSFAQYDNAIRTERTRLGKLHRVKQHQWHGGPPPFGYRLLDRKLAIDAREAEKVKDIFERYGAGESAQTIKKHLDKSDVLPRRGSTWSVGSIQALLRNTHYIGSYRFRDKKESGEIEVPCPPLISMVLWQQAEDRRHAALKKRGQLNRTTRFYLLRDLLFCGYCGKPLGARTKPSKAENFYYCPSKERDWKLGIEPAKKHSKKNGCGFSRSMNIERVDKIVWNAVTDVHSKSSLLKEDVKRRLLTGVTHPEEGFEVAQKSAEKSIRRTKADLDLAEEAITELEVERRLKKTERDYPKILKRLEEEKRRIVARLEALKDGVKNRAAARKWIDWVREFGDEVQAKASLSPEEKRRYLQGMIERIDVKFLPETREHQLEIRFQRPIVDDGLHFTAKRVYKLVDGSPAKQLNVPLSGCVIKRLTPVGDNAVTVE